MRRARWLTLHRLRAYCGAINAVPGAYREELRLARNLDEATRTAIEEWARLEHRELQNSWESRDPYHSLFSLRSAQVLRNPLYPR